MNGDLRLRQDIPAGDKWDLSSLFSDEAVWEEGLKEYEALIPGIGAFKRNPGERGPPGCGSVLIFSTPWRCWKSGWATMLCSARRRMWPTALRAGRFSRYMAVTTKSNAESSFLKT